MGDVTNPGDRYLCGLACEADRASPHRHTAPSLPIKLAASVQAACQPQYLRH